MNKFAKKSIEGAAVLFAGQGDLVIFDKVDKYEDAVGSPMTIADFENPKSLGAIVQDTTSWDGDDVEVSQIKDEQGNLITAKTTAGTLAFSFEIASTSRKMIAMFLAGKEYSALGSFQSDASGVGSGWTGSMQGVGFGTELPVLTNRPVAIINDAQDRVWLYSKCKISSNLSYSDGLWRIKASVIAEKVDLQNIKTAMVIEPKSAE